MNDRPSLGDFFDELMTLIGDRVRQLAQNPAAALFLFVLVVMFLPSMGRMLLPLLALLFLIMVVWGALRSAGRENQSFTERVSARTDRPQSGKQRGKSIHPIAVQAMQRAGQDPATMVVTPVDVGLLAYNADGNDPVGFRDERLPDDAGYVRPFAVLRSPRRARGKVRFELLDGEGMRRFIDVVEATLDSGDTLVYPPTWLPVSKLPSLDGDWLLRLYGASTLLAAHEFHWRDPGGGDFRAALTGDGEIKGDPMEEIKERRDRLSLDDLLADQEGGLVEADPEIEAAARQMERLNRQRARRR